MGWVLLPLGRKEVMMSYELAFEVVFESGVATVYAMDEREVWVEYDSVEDPILYVSCVGSFA